MDRCNVYCRVADGSSADAHALIDEEVIAIPAQVSLGVLSKSLIRYLRPDPDSQEFPSGSGKHAVRRYRTCTLFAGQHRTSTDGNHDFEPLPSTVSAAHVLVDDANPQMTFLSEFFSRHDQRKLDAVVVGHGPISPPRLGTARITLLTVNTTTMKVTDVLAATSADGLQSMGVVLDGSVDAFGTPTGAHGTHGSGYTSVVLPTRETFATVLRMLFVESQGFKKNEGKLSVVVALSLDDVTTGITYEHTMVVLQAPHFVDVKRAVRGGEAATGSSRMFSFLARPVSRLALVISVCKNEPGAFPTMVSFGDLAAAVREAAERMSEADSASAEVGMSRESWRSSSWLHGTDLQRSARGLSSAPQQAEVTPHQNMTASAARGGQQTARDVSESAPELQTPMRGAATMSPSPRPTPMTGNNPDIMKRRQGELQMRILVIQNEIHKLEQEQEKRAQSSSPSVKLRVKLDQVTQQLRELGSAHDVLEQQLAATVEQVGDEKKAVDHAEQREAELRVDERELLERVQQQEAGLGELKLEHSRLTVDVADAEKQLQTVENAHDSEDAELRDLRHKNAYERESLLNRYQNDFCEAEHAATKLFFSLQENVVVQAATLEKEYAVRSLDHQARKADLQRDLERLQQEIYSLQTRRDVTADEVERKRTAVSKTEAANDELTKKLADSSSQHEELVAAMTEARKSVVDEGIRITKHTTSVTAVKEELQRHRKLQSESTARLNEVQKKFAALLVHDPVGSRYIEHVLQEEALRRELLESECAEYLCGVQLNRLCGGGVALGSERSMGGFLESSSHVNHVLSERVLRDKVRSLTKAIAKGEDERGKIQSAHDDSKRKSDEADKRHARLVNELRRAHDKLRREETKVRNGTRLEQKCGQLRRLLDELLTKKEDLERVMQQVTMRGISTAPLPDVPQHNWDSPVLTTDLLKLSATLQRMLRERTSSEEVKARADSMRREVEEKEAEVAEKRDAAQRLRDAVEASQKKLSSVRQAMKEREEDIRAKIGVESRIREELQLQCWNVEKRLDRQQQVLIGEIETCEVKCTELEATRRQLETEVNRRRKRKLDQSYDTQGAGARLQVHQRQQEKRLHSTMEQLRNLMADHGCMDAVQQLNSLIVPPDGTEDDHHVALLSGSVNAILSPIVDAVTNHIEAETVANTRLRREQELINDALSRAKQERGLRHVPRVSSTPVSVEAAYSSLYPDGAPHSRQHSRTASSTALESESGGNRA